MHLDKTDTDTFLARLLEARQNLDEIFAMVDRHPDAATLITKLNSCSKQLDRASFALMVSSLQGTAGASETEKTENIRHLEHLFLNQD